MSISSGDFSIFMEYSKWKLYICCILITLFSDLSRVPECLTAYFLFQRSDIRNHVGISGRTRWRGALFTSANSQCQLTETPSILLKPLNITVLLLQISRKKQKQQMWDLHRKQAVRQMEDRSVSFPSCTQTHHWVCWVPLSRKCQKAFCFLQNHLDAGCCHRWALPQVHIQLFFSFIHQNIRGDVRPSVSRVFLLVQKGFVSVLVLVAPLRWCTTSCQKNAFTNRC